jgi:hypothetical protein
MNRRPRPSPSPASKVKEAVARRQGQCSGLTRPAGPNPTPLRRVSPGGLAPVRIHADNKYLQPAKNSTLNEWRQGLH